MQPAPKEEIAPPPTKKEEKKEEARLKNRAQLVVAIPTEARLFIDNHQMRSSSSSRRFVTPPLQPGRTYFYDLRAELVRDGRTITENRRIILRPGDTIQADFAGLGGQATETAQASDER